MVKKWRVGHIFVFLMLGLFIEGQARTIQFSGYNWEVKSSEKRMNPGKNYFSDSQENVWVDSLGRLHLTILKKEGKWLCSEVICQEKLNYGTYQFFINSRIDSLDENVILGLFSYDPQEPKHHNEIDIEIARWGQKVAPNVQYVVQPYQDPDNRKNFDVKLNGLYSTHGFIWNPDHIFFHSYYGHHNYPPAKDHIISVWNYERNYIPKPDQARIHINLYLLHGQPPVNDRPVEIIINNFSYKENRNEQPLLNQGKNSKH